MIDHTLLKAEATEEDVRKLCAEAAKNCFMSVCVNPAYVALSAKLLRGTGVKVCTVVGFPLGATPTRVKELETRIAIDEGADEIDMVINIGAMKSGNYKLVESDIRGVVRATRGNVISKVILETCYLTKEEIRKASELSKAAGANFVKTSTGFGPGGAKAEDIRIMREVVGDTMGVKASGGVRDHETALNLIMAGASRIGASASVAIVECTSAGSGKY
ncbi:MAG: deoxyribose-phosphate aldolase [Leptospiraceae bacterium]|nr:deoxyribose-phosphate aldolase [Leptospiraceae bacterium]